MIKNKKKEMNKSAQGMFGMSFSMIFSIILIILFMVIAFIVIRSFLATKDCAMIGRFYSDFEEKVNLAWNDQESSFEFTRSLPANVDYICFYNKTNQLKGEYKEIGDDLETFGDKKHNLFLFPRDAGCEMPSKDLKHVDIDKITASNNPNCIKVVNSKILLTIDKRFNERLVRIIK
jgi:hypothetical protein